MRRAVVRTLVAGCVSIVTASMAIAQQPAAVTAAQSESADLAKKLSNPISDLVSVPFQFNWEQNVGPDEQTRFILNVQPVIPFAWSAGPTVVALKQTGPWTYGALWNQVWSFSGNPDRDDVNQMFLQPFLAYQATHTITLTVQSETTANWEVDEGRWTVPINVLVSKLSSFGTFPASYAVGCGGFVDHPDVGPSWKIRGAIVILLPRRR
jgi:hypothetical protein